MNFQLGTAVAVMGFLTVVAVYFLWVRKLAPKKDEQQPEAGAK